MSEIPKPTPDSIFALQSHPRYLWPLHEGENDVYVLNSLVTRSRLPIMQGELTSRPQTFLSEFRIPYDFSVATIHNFNVEEVANAINADLPHIELTEGRRTVSRTLARFYNKNYNTVLQLTALPMVQSLSSYGNYADLALSTMHPYQIYASIVPFNNEKLDLGVSFEDANSRVTPTDLLQAAGDAIHPVSGHILSIYSEKVAVARSVNSS